MNGLVRHPLGRRNWNSKGPAARPCWYFFRFSRRSAQRIRTRGKTVSAEFYKGVMDPLLERIQRVRSAAFCSRDFFLLHDNAPVLKAASVCQFWPNKCYNPLSRPVLPSFISARLFSVPQVENDVKRLHFADVAEIQEAVTDELKNVQKRTFRQLFRNCTTAQKPAYMLYISK